MRVGTTNAPIVRGNLLPRSSLAAAVAQRAMHVTDLLLTRRRFALAYRRSASDGQLMKLKKIDAELAKYNITILTIPTPAKTCLEWGDAGASEPAAGGAARSCRDSSGQCVTARETE
jgi:hypothetical protein